MSRSARNPAPQNFTEFLIFVVFMLGYIGLCLVWMVGSARLSVPYLHHRPDAWPGALLVSFGGPILMTLHLARKQRLRLASQNKN